MSSSAIVFSQSESDNPIGKIKMNTPNTLKRILMGPGPSDVDPRVLEALSRPTIGHLDPAFLEVLNGVRDLLQYTFQTKNKMTFAVSGTGSACCRCSDS